MTCHIVIPIYNMIIYAYNFKFKIHFKYSGKRWDRNCNRYHTMTTEGFDLTLTLKKGQNQQPGQPGGSSSRWPFNQPRSFRTCAADLRSSSCRKSPTCFWAPSRTEQQQKRPLSGSMFSTKTSQTLWWLNDRFTAAHVWLTRISCSILTWSTWSRTVLWETPCDKFDCTTSWISMACRMLGGQLGEPSISVHSTDRCSAVQIFVWSFVMRWYECFCHEMFGFVESTRFQGFSPVARWGSLVFMRGEETLTQNTGGTHPRAHTHTHPSILPHILTHSRRARTHSRNPRGYCKYK